MHTSPATYLPLELYGAIGNLRSVALIGCHGSIDWCCFPALSDPSVFAALLDVQKGGRFRVAPAGAGQGRQEYLEDTNILITRFDTQDGRLRITDLMPIRGNIDGRSQTNPAAEIHRILHCEAGRMTVEVEWSPRLDYARDDTVIVPTAEGYLARAIRRA